MLRSMDPRIISMKLPYLCLVHSNYIIFKIKVLTQAGSPLLWTLSIEEIYRIGFDVCFFVIEVVGLRSHLYLVPPSPALGQR